MIHDIHILKENSPNTEHTNTREMACYQVRKQTNPVDHTSLVNLRYVNGSWTITSGGLTHSHTNGFLSRRSQLDSNLVKSHGVYSGRWTTFIFLDCSARTFSQTW